jgi:hypothetical protein
VTVTLSPDAAVYSFAASVESDFAAFVTAAVVPSALSPAPPQAASEAVIVAAIAHANTFFIFLIALLLCILLRDQPFTAPELSPPTRFFCT